MPDVTQPVEPVETLEDDQTPLPQVADTQDQVDDDEAENDAQVADWFASRGKDLLQADTKAPAAPTPSTPLAPTPAAAPAATPQGLADADKELARRWQMDDEDITALAALPEPARNKLVKSLRDRTAHVDRLTSEFNQWKAQQQANPNPQQQQAAPTANPQQQAWKSPDDAWKPLAEAYGAEGFADPFRQAVESTVFAAMQHLQQRQPQEDPAAAQMQSQQVQYMEQEQFETTLEKLPLPDGVTISPEVRQKLHEKAFELAQQGGWNVFDNSKNWRHYLPQAAAVLFPVQAIQAERTQRAASAQHSRRGSAESGQRQAISRITPPDPEAEETALVRGILDKHGIKR